jgi:HD superfamily phosphohydrolase
MATKKLVLEWMPPEGTNELNLFYKGIDDFVTLNLTELYDEQLSLSADKVFADPLHGYIQLKSWEISIIDTFLFQRLRKISQLGLANYVFPSLNYTRFEHSIGVLGTINVLLIKLIENSEEDNKQEIEKIINQYEIPLRIAALLHDIGHCLYSHCSERVIANLSKSKKIIEIFTKHFGKQKDIPFAEIFAISIIGNQHFANFVKNLGIPKKNDKEIFDKLGIAANFILGLPANNNSKTVFLSQLISSGLDADKIDYMARESLYSGIKLEIDLNRIFSKISIFDLKPKELPDNLKFLNTKYTEDTTYKVLGLKKGGQFNFEEFCIARLALHVKIYLHQKVRAIESQLSRYLELLSKDTILENSYEWLKIPESIIDHEDYIIGKIEKEKNLFSPDINHRNISFAKLKSRNINNRAFGFGFMNCFTKNANTKIQDFTQTIEELNQNRVIVEDEIFNEYKEICKKLELSPKEIRNEIILDIPRYINIQQGHDSLYFQRPKNALLQWTIPIDKIMVYYQYNRALTYVFAPKEICSLLCVAVEMIIYKRTNFVFNQESIISENIFKEVIKYKNTLQQKGYYNDIPQITPLSDYLNSADANEKIAVVLENLKRFKSYQGDVVSFNNLSFG